MRTRVRLCKPLGWGVSGRPAQTTLKTQRTFDFDVLYAEGDGCEAAASPAAPEATAPDASTCVWIVNPETNRGSWWLRDPTAEPNGPLRPDSRYLHGGDRRPEIVVIHDYNRRRKRLCPNPITWLGTTPWGERTVSIYPCKDRKCPGCFAHRRSSMIAAGMGEVRACKRARDMAFTMSMPYWKTFIADQAWRNAESPPTRRGKPRRNVHREMLQMLMETNEAPAIPFKWTYITADDPANDRVIPRYHHETMDSARRRYKAWEDKQVDYGKTCFLKRLRSFGVPLRQGTYPERHKSGQKHSHLLIFETGDPVLDIMGKLASFIMPKGYRHPARREGEHRTDYWRRVLNDAWTGWNEWRSLADDHSEEARKRRLQLPFQICRMGRKNFRVIRDNRKRRGDAQYALRYVTKNVAYVTKEAGRPSSSPGWGTGKSPEPSPDFAGDAARRPEAREAAEHSAAGTPVCDKAQPTPARPQGGGGVLQTGTPPDPDATRVASDDRCRISTYRQDKRPSASSIWAPMTPKTGPPYRLVCEAVDGPVSRTTDPCEAKEPRNLWWQPDGPGGEWLPAARKQPTRWVFDPMRPIPFRWDTWRPTDEQLDLMKERLFRQLSRTRNLKGNRDV